MFNWSKSDKNKTFRPVKKIDKGTPRHELHKFAKSTLGSGDLQEAVKLPENEDLNEWLAVNTIDFFNTTNLLYGSVSEHCTQSDCPVMSAGPKYEYLWCDGVKIKKPLKVSAPDYIELLMAWIEDHINNETVFPPSGGQFPKNFQDLIANIFRRIFRVYAHMYYNHFSKIQDLGQEAHLNTAFKHLMYFVYNFNLVPKEEMMPMRDCMINLMGEDFDPSKEEKTK